MGTAAACCRKETDELFYCFELELPLAGDYGGGVENVNVRRCRQGRQRLGRHRF